MIAIIGLGEAGSAIAADLAAAGVMVRGFDPAPAELPAGVERPTTSATPPSTPT